MISLVVGLRSSKALPKAKTCIQKWSWSLVVCCWSDPLQLSESWRNHYSREVWPANRSDTPKTAMPAASTGQQTGPRSSPWQCPITCRTSEASKVEQIGFQSFVFTWPLANRLPFLQAARQLFAGKTLPQPAGCRKCCLSIRRIPKHGFLCFRNKQNHFSLAKICWL